jgi:hypothetical protein
MKAALSITGKKQRTLYSILQQLLTQQRNFNMITFNKKVNEKKTQERAARLMEDFFEDPENDFSNAPELIEQFGEAEKTEEIAEMLRSVRDHMRSFVHRTLKFTRNLERFSAELEKTSN